eukprot:CFRG0860T1
MKIVKIEGENAYQLALRIKYEYNKKKEELGVEVLDSLLEGQDLGAGDVVEVFGPPTSGKSQLIMETICQFIMPKAYKGIDIHGKQEGVLLFDVDGRFSVVRLVQILEQKIARSLGEEMTSLDLDTSEIVIRSCLDRLFIVRCMDSISMLTSVKHARHSIISMETPVRLVAVDGLSHLRWHDRLHTQRSKKSTSSRPKGIPQICSALLSLVEEHRLLLFVTTNCLNGQAEQAKTVPYMGNEWNRSVTRRFIVRRLSSQVLACYLTGHTKLLNFEICNAGVVVRR